MLAALLATRQTPPPPLLVYGNQFSAAASTFPCIAITKKAAFITTSLPIRYSLVLSLPGRESIFDQLSRAYVRLISQTAADSPTYLNTTIIQIISILVNLTSVLQTLPVAPQNTATLGRFQQRLAIALYRLRSLGRQSYPPEWPDERDAFG